MGVFKFSLLALLISVVIGYLFQLHLFLPLNIANVYDVIPTQFMNLFNWEKITKVPVKGKKNFWICSLTLFFYLLNQLTTAAIKLKNVIIKIKEWVILKKYFSQFIAYCYCSTIYIKHSCYSSICLLSFKFENKNIFKTVNNNLFLILNERKIQKHEIL